MVLYKGEIRDVTVEVTETSGQEFTIDECKYQIVNSKGDSVLKDNASINGNLIGMLFNADTLGKFKIIFYIRIGQEIRMFSQVVEVQEL